MTPLKKLSGARLTAVILVPWVFLAVFLFMFTRFLWPRIAEGQPIAVIVGVLVASMFVSSTLAAVTFSGDVLAGRYPREA
jgi:hypothetical protein